MSELIEGRLRLRAELLGAGSRVEMEKVDWDDPAGVEMDGDVVDVVGTALVGAVEEPASPMDDGGFAAWASGRERQRLACRLRLDCTPKRRPHVSHWNADNCIMIQFVSAGTRAIHCYGPFSPV